MPISESLKLQIRVEANRAVRELNKVRTSTERVEKQARSMSDTFKLLKGAAVVGAITLVGKKLFDIAAASVRSAGAFEKQKVAFEVLLGSVNKSNKLLGEIREFAAATPFETMGLIKGAKMLLAYGVESEKVIGNLKMLGDVSMGNRDVMDRITYAYGQMRSKGKIALEELNIMTEAGVPILQELAKNYDVTTAEMLKMITLGKVGFADVERGLKTLTSEGGKFFGMTEKTAQTYEGMLSTVQSNMEELKVAFGELILPWLKEILPQVTVILKDLKLIVNAGNDTADAMQKFNKEGWEALSLTEKRLVAEKKLAGLRTVPSIMGGEFIAREEVRKWQMILNSLKGTVEQNIEVVKTTKDVAQETTKMGEAAGGAAKKFDSLFAAMQAVRGAAMAIATLNLNLGIGPPRGIGPTGKAGGGGTQAGPVTGGQGQAQPGATGAGGGAAGMGSPFVPAVMDIEAATSALKTFYATGMEGMGALVAEIAQGTADMKDFFKQFVVSALHMLSALLIAAGPYGWIGAGFVEAAIGAVQALGEGGIVRKPTLALIGEKGPEAVVPLNQNGATGNVTIIVRGSIVTERQLSYIVAKNMSKMNRGY